MKHHLLLIGIAAALLGSVCGCNNAPKPGEEMTPEQLSEFADVPLYPNAKVPDGESHVPQKDAAGEMNYEIVQTTGDSPQSVSEWYEKRLGWRSQGSNLDWNLMGITKKGNEAAIGIYKEGDFTRITIRSIAHSKN